MLLALLLGCARPQPSIRPAIPIKPEVATPPAATPIADVAPWPQRQRASAEPGPVRRPEEVWRRALGAPLTQPIFVGHAALWLNVGGEVLRVERDGQVSLRRMVEGSTGLVELPLGLLIGGQDGALRALSPETGEALSSWPGQGRARGQAMPLGGGAAWLCSDGTLHHTASGLLGALPAAGGELSSDGRLLVAPTQGPLVLAFRADGLHWRVRLAGRPVGPALLAGNRAHLAWENGVQGGVTTLDLETGAELWTRELAVAPSAPLALSRSRLLVGQLDGSLRALDPGGGDELWSVRLGPDELRLAPLVSGDDAWLADRGGRLHRVDLQDGGVAWSFPLGAVPTSGPELAWGLLILGLANGELLALRGGR